MRGATDVKSAIQLDDDWFRELWADCPNPVLVELIEQFMRRTRRYELAAMREQDTVASSAGAKNEVYEFLRAGNLTAACKRESDTPSSCIRSYTGVIGRFGSLL